MSTKKAKIIINLTAKEKSKFTAILVRMYEEEKVNFRKACNKRGNGSTFSYRQAINEWVNAQK